MTIPGVVRGVNDGRTKASFFLQKTWEEKVSHKLKRVKWYWETDIHDKWIHDDWINELGLEGWIGVHQVERREKVTLYACVQTESDFTFCFIFVTGCPSMSVPICMSGSSWKPQRAGTMSATLHLGMAQPRPFRHLIKAVWALQLPSPASRVLALSLLCPDHCPGHCPVLEEGMWAVRSQRHEKGMMGNPLPTISPVYLGIPHCLLKGIRKSLNSHLQIVNIILLH